MLSWAMLAGLFYLRANARTIELMSRLEDLLSRKKTWDQTAYNQEMFLLSHGKYKSPQVWALSGLSGCIQVLLGCGCHIQIDSLVACQPYVHGSRTNENRS